MAVTITSTTGTQEDVNLAAGLAADAPAPEDKGADKPAGGADDTAKQDADKKQAAGATQAGDEEEEHRPKKKGGFQRIIDRQDRTIVELRERVAHLEGRTEGVTPKPQPKKAEADPEPKVEDAKYKGKADGYDQYLEDRARWAARDEHRKMSASESQRQLTEEENERTKEAYDSHLGRMAKASKEIDDWADVVSPTAQLKIQEKAAPYVVPAIVESPISHLITYYLYKHPEVIDQMNELPPARQGVFIGRIEKMLEDQMEAQAPKDDKKDGKAAKDAGAAAGGRTAGAAAAGDGSGAKRAVSRAPEPITPVNGAPTRGPQTLSDLAKTDPKRYRELRRQGRYQ